MSGKCRDRSKGRSSCSDNQICNPASGYCVSKTGKIGKRALIEWEESSGAMKIEQKPSLQDQNYVNNLCKSTRENLSNTICSDEKICNPKTGRCVDRKGKLGKEAAILWQGDNDGVDVEKQNADGRSKIRDIPVPGRCLSNGKLKECKQGQICNPKSGRCVNLDGAAGQKALKLWAKREQSSAKGTIAKANYPEENAQQVVEENIAIVEDSYPEKAEKVISINVAAQQPENKNSRLPAVCNINSIPACSISQCVTGVNGLVSSSLSPSDFWLLEFKSGTYYETEDKPVLVSNAIMKIFVTYSSAIEVVQLLRTRLDNPLYFPIDEKYSPDYERALVVECYDNLRFNLPAIFGVNYEADVYLRIIKPLLDNNICPHFVRPYTGKINCSFSEIVKILQSVPKADLSLKYSTINNLLFQEIDWHGKKRRQRSISTALSDKQLGELAKSTCKYRAFDKVSYSFIVTQYMDPQYSSTFTKVIKDYSDRKIDARTMFLLLFQIAYACYALFLSRVAHNDLHSDNIFCTRRNMTKNITYKISDSISYNFADVQYCARIYDFDRAFANSIGLNKSLTPDLCSNFGSCNEVINAKDFAKVICSVVTLTDKTGWIFSLLNNPTDEKIKSWRRIFRKTGCYTQKANVSIDWNDLATYPEILDKLYRGYVSNDGKIHDGKPDDTYTCMPDMFTVTGILKPSMPSS